MNKSLKTIQGFSKAGKILSKIVFIFSIVMFCTLAVGLIGLMFGSDVFKLGGESIASYIEDEAQLSLEAIYSSAITGMIISACEIFIAKTAENYFKFEINEKTPFTFEGAKKMRTLGIVTVCVTLASQPICGIADSITAKVMGSAESFESDATANIIIGVTFIIVSFLCSYGAEILNEKTNALPNANSDNSSVSQNVAFENFKVTDETVTFPVADVNSVDNKNSDAENDG